MMKVIDEWQTLAKLKEGCSICRFGSGELRLCLNEHSAFQRYDRGLKKKLRNALKTSREDLLIGVPRIYEGTAHLNADWVDIPMWKSIASRSIRMLDPQKTYYSAFISRPEAVKGLFTEEYFTKIKEIWKNKEIFYLGNVRKGIEPGRRFDFFTEKEILEHDLFDNTDSITYNSAPIQDAFAKYEEFYNQCLSTNKLILLSLGPTATVLAYELQGKQVIDIGQLLMIYDSFKKNAQPKHVSDQEWARRNRTTADVPELL